VAESHKEPLLEYEDDTVDNIDEEVIKRAMLSNKRPYSRINPHHQDILTKRIRLEQNDEDEDEEDDDGDVELHEEEEQDQEGSGDEENVEVGEEDEIEEEEDDEEHEQQHEEEDDDDDQDAEQEEPQPQMLRTATTSVGYTTAVNEDILVPDLVGDSPEFVRNRNRRETVYFDALDLTPNCSCSEAPYLDAGKEEPKILIKKDISTPIPMDKIVRKSKIPRFNKRATSTFEPASIQLLNPITIQRTPADQLGSNSKHCPAKKSNPKTSKIFPKKHGVCCFKQH